MRLKLLFANSFLMFTMILAILFGASAASGQTSSFTYQGRVTDGGTAANGNYDLQFALLDSLSGGAQVGSTQSLNTVAVSNGVVNVSLDFGANAFNGANRFLEISARPSGGGTFTLLSPRQQITSTPYAVRSLNASSADSVPASGVPAGSGNYIQNSAGQQASSNFNISGNGTAGGTLSGNVVNATTQYNLNGSRILSNAGTANLFAGVGAGSDNAGDNNSFFGLSAGGSNTTGNNNAFFGLSAGGSNTTGNDNAFFGLSAGGSNTTGSVNAFFGRSAGALNTTGNNNTFFGNNAGSFNTTGSGNTIIGNSADVTLGNLSNATAIGAGARVDSSNAVELGTTNTKVGIGTTAPLRTLQIGADTNALFTFEGTSGTPNAGYIRFGDNSGWKLHFGRNREDSVGALNSGTAGVLMTIQDNGRVGIGTKTPDQLLSVNGNASKVGGGSWASFSDERLKNIKGRFTPGLNAVMRLQPLRYEYKRDNALNLKSDGQYVGFSAQAVLKIISEAVTANDKSYLLINNDPTMWTMLKAIKEQQAQIAKLRTANAALNARLRALEKSRRKRVSSRRSRD